MTPDARSAALAGSVTGAADNITSLYWNPGGLALITDKEVSATYMSWIGGSSYFNGMYGMQLGPGSIAAGFTYFSTGEQVSRTSISDPGEAFRNIAGMFSAGYGLTVGGIFNIGGTIKYGFETVSEDMLNAVMADVGGRVNLINDTLHIGLLAQNLGYASGKPPINFRLGVSYDMLLGNTIALTPMIQTDIKTDSKSAINAGAELTILDNYNIRAGYNLDIGGSDAGGLEGLTIGLGASVSMFTIDIAWLPMGFFGNSFIATFSVNF